jgi:hypothetical protein
LLKYNKSQSASKPLKKWPKVAYTCII